MPKFKRLYLFRNPSFPHLLKIGETHDVMKRLRQLNRSSGCPDDFEVCAVYQLTAKCQTDKVVHALLSEFRHRDNREFFALSIQEAKRKIKKLGLREVDPISGFSLHGSVRRRRSNTTMKSLGLFGPFSIVLKNHPRVKARMIAPKKVRYKGVILSLSEATHQARLDVGAPLASEVNGYIHWCPEGSAETLYEIRLRLERIERKRLRVAA